MSKLVVIVLSLCFISACKTTLPQPSEGVERGPISKLIWGESDTQTDKFSEDVLAEVSSSETPNKHKNVYDGGYNWEYFFTAYRKMSKYFSYEANATELMKLYYPGLYKKYRNDEFELASQRAAAVKKIKQETNEFDQTIVHQFFTEWDFGKYDFPIKGIRINIGKPTAPDSLAITLSTPLAIAKIIQ